MFKGGLQGAGGAVAPVAALGQKGDRGGVKICRQCDRDRRKDEREQKKAQGGGSSSKRQREDEDAEDECAGDTLVQIIEILQCRRAHGL